MGHVIVRNGGEFLLPDATEKANIVSNYKLSRYEDQYLTNSVISNSAGYGIVIEENSPNFEFDAPESNSTFSNNSSGNILIK